MPHRLAARPSAVSVSVTCAHPEPGPAPADPAGVSPLAAKVLDQLSVTAWLPAALLVANTYVVCGMFLVRDGGEPATANLAHVVTALDERPVGIILAVVLGIVVATIVTQSLEYAAIRFLEGYWGGTLLGSIPTWIGVQAQQVRKAAMRRRIARLDARAFRLAAPLVRLALQDDPVLAGVVIRLGLGQPVGPDGASRGAEARAYYGRKQWRAFGPAHLRHRALSVVNRLNAYPAPSRTLPTRLGNVMRHHEDLLHGVTTGARMRAYLFDDLDRVPPRLLQQHDQYRSRLDMCSVLTLMSAMLAVLDAALLPQVLPEPWVWGTCAGWLLLAYLSYRGAIAAALDYGPILLAIDRKNRTAGQD